VTEGRREPAEAMEPEPATDADEGHKTGRRLRSP
jgi:hypothetical protein